MKPIIEVNHLFKKYTLGERQPYYSLRDAVSNIFEKPFKKHPLKKNDFWALKDISFKLNEGEVLGIIGPNGSGKSTLLKVISKITPPTKGKIILRGRVGSLLEVGTGFHPELTGRENIFLNGAILGMKTWEIKRKFDEIVDFAEVEKFLDSPVKHYSSGMYMRLAFAIAAHLEPEILIVDEVLAVGDAQFQKKCLGKMGDISKKEGRTVLFVSHNMGIVSELCDKSIYLDKGNLVKMGESKLVISKYINKFNLSKNIFWDSKVNLDKHLQILEIKVFKKKNKKTNIFDINEDIFIKIKSNTIKQIYGSVIVLRVLRNGIELFRSYDSDSLSERLVKRPMGITFDRVIINKGLLKAGSYQVIVSSAVLNKNWNVDEGGSVSFTVSELSEDTSSKSYAESRDGFIRTNLKWRKIS